jgi:hypothetical protein
MPTKQVDLVSLFNAVNQTLKENKTSLNDADVYNHDHGDNMVKNFKVITKAVREKKGALPAEQLMHASQLLSQSSNSGSAQMYSQNLAQAAGQLTGQKAVTAENALSLVQALLGGQQGGQAQPEPTQPASGDLMGQLLGSLLGGSAPDGQPMQPASNQSSDALGGLMGALLGGQTPSSPSGHPISQQPDVLGGLMGALLGGGSGEQPAQTAPTGGAAGGFDLNTLLGAGMAYMQASQQGVAPMEALVQAVLAGSQMNASPHHAQSGQLVAGTLINTLGSLLSGKQH